MHKTPEVVTLLALAACLQACTWLARRDSSNGRMFSGRVTLKIGYIAGNS